VSWSAVRILPSESQAGRDAIVAALFACGAQAVVEDGPAIVTHFRATADLAPIRLAILAADPGATITDAPIGDEDWSVAWRSRVKAHDAGSFTVTPPWRLRRLCLSVASPLHCPSLNFLCNYLI